MAFKDNVSNIKKKFSSCETLEERYQMIIDFGKNLKTMDDEKKIESNRILGCQSITYVSATYKDGKVFFEASSDALISLGLAAILIAAYNQETPKIILKEDPTFLKELGIEESISPNRATGLYEMVQHMKKLALSFFMKKN